jgi:hypothetical protein
MKIGKFIKTIVRVSDLPLPKTVHSTKPRKAPVEDFRFTSNFAAKAKEWGLTEDHARLVYYEGDTVKGKGKENMKVMMYKGEEIGIYAFHDRETNKPVVTSIWKRPKR